MNKFKIGDEVVVSYDLIRTKYKILDIHYGYMDNVKIFNYSVINLINGFSCSGVAEDNLKLYEERKIIGYKIRDKKYKPCIEFLTRGFFDNNFIHPKDAVYTINQYPTAIKTAKDLHLLEVYFEPVYAPEERVIHIRSHRITISKERITINNEVVSTEALKYVQSFDLNASEILSIFTEYYKL